MNIIFYNQTDHEIQEHPNGVRPTTHTIFLSSIELLNSINEFHRSFDADADDDDDGVYLRGLCVCVCVCGRERTPHC